MEMLDYRVKVPGNSGCTVEVIDLGHRPAVRKLAKSEAYQERLTAQRRKQEKITSSVAGIRIPRVIAFDEKSFTMEYFHMLDSIEYFEQATPKAIRRQVESIFAFVAEEFSASSMHSVEPGVFLDKLDSIRCQVPTAIWSEFYEIHAIRLLKLLGGPLIVPLGPCHGDLTFSNVMFSIEDSEVGLIDFLDSFVETPLIDLVKLRQDTRFLWTSRRYTKLHDALKIAITMEWVDGLLLREFSDRIALEAFSVFERFNYFRIAPYVGTMGEHKFLSDVLAVLSSSQENE